MWKEREPREGLGRERAKKNSATRREVGGLFTGTGEPTYGSVDMYDITDSMIWRTVQLLRS